MTEKEYTKLYNLAYREAHREEINARQRQYYAEHKEETKAYHKAYRKTERFKEWRRGYLQTDKGREMQKAAMYKYNHSEKGIAARKRAYLKRKAARANAG